MIDFREICQSYFESSAVDADWNESHFIHWCLMIEMFKDICKVDPLVCATFQLRHILRSSGAILIISSRLFTLKSVFFTDTHRPQWFPSRSRSIRIMFWASWRYLSVGRKTEPNRHTMLVEYIGRLYSLVAGNCPLKLHQWPPRDCIISERHKVLFRIDLCFIFFASKVNRRLIFNDRLSSSCSYNFNYRLLIFDQAHEFDFRVESNRNS